jgi:hypothetical protein
MSEAEVRFAEMMKEVVEADPLGPFRPLLVGLLVAIGACGVIWLNSNGEITSGPLLIPVAICARFFGVRPGMFGAVLSLMVLAWLMPNLAPAETYCRLDGTLMGILAIGLSAGWFWPIEDWLGRLARRRQAPPQSSMPRISASA